MLLATITNAKWHKFPSSWMLSSKGPSFLGVSLDCWQVEWGESKIAQICEHPKLIVPNLVFKRDLARALLRIWFVLSLSLFLLTSQKLPQFMSHSQLCVSQHLLFEIPKEFTKNSQIRILKLYIPKLFPQNQPKNSEKFLQKIPQKNLKKFQTNSQKF